MMILEYFKIPCINMTSRFLISLFIRSLLSYLIMFTCCSSTKGGEWVTQRNPDAAPLGKHQEKATEQTICIINLIEKLVKLNI